MIHGQRYKPDLGPCYAQGSGPRFEQDLWLRYTPDRGQRHEQDYGPRYAPGCGPRFAPDRGPRNCRTNLRATAPLDPQASGPTAQIHINGHRGPSPLEPAAGVTSRRCWDQTRTRPTGVYTPLDRTTRTALPAFTCLDQQPLARDPAGVGGVAWANS